MERFPCGHTPDEERVYENATQGNAELFTRMIADLRANRLGPPPYPTLSYQTQWATGVKEYFRWLKKRVPKIEYRGYATRFTEALEADLALPTCKRHGLQVFPTQIPGLPQLTDLSTPRTGGRPPTRTVQERNARIAELKRAGTDHQAICKHLDAHGFTPPSAWSKDGLVSWRKAYKRPEYRQRVHTIFSKVR